LLFMHRAESGMLGLCKLLFGRTELVTAGVWPFVDSLVYSLPISVAVLVAVSLLTRPDKALAESCFASLKKEQ